MNSERKDSQLTELIGRHFLIAQLVAGGLEVAVPVRDRGVDLIAYLDLSTETGRFVSCPIQMKASQEARFGLEKKYEKIANLLIAYPSYVAIRPYLTILQQDGFIERSSGSNMQGTVYELTAQGQKALMAAGVQLV
jgi:hypothetical protein